MDYHLRWVDGYLSRLDPSNSEIEAHMIILYERLLTPYPVFIFTMD